MDEEGANLLKLDVTSELAPLRRAAALHFDFTRAYSVHAYDTHYPHYTFYNMANG